MTRYEKLRYEMFLRVRDFGSAHQQEFPDGSMGGKAFRGVEAAIAQIEANATAKALTAEEGKQAKAIARVPHHLMARAGLALVERCQTAHPTHFSTTTGPMAPRASGSLAHPPRIEILPPAAAPSLSVHTAIARAISLVAAGDAAGAAQLVGDALASAPPGSAGWLIPIEPLLRVQRDHVVWAQVLATLRMRAA